MACRIAFSDFEPESVKTYRVWFSTKHPDHAWTKLPDDRFLEMIGAASDDCEDKRLHPTGAGLLMFGKEYKITREYPAYFLDYKDHADPTVRWTDRIFSQLPDWSGNVFDFFTLVSRKLLRMLKVPFKLKDMVRVDETPMHNAVREALVNCLVNADYFLSRGVQIDSYDDRIVMKNPGLSIVGKRQMLRGGDSEPRNASIMKMFNLLGFGEHAGSGVPDIFSVWEDAGYVEPTIEEMFGGEANEPDKTVVTLPLVEKEASWGDTIHDATHDTTHDDFMRLVDFCETPRTRKEMMDFMQLVNRQHFANHYLKPLLKTGKIAMTIPDKPKSRNQKYVKK